MLSSCGLEVADFRKNCDCGVSVAEQHFFKSCGIAIVEVLPSSAELQLQTQIQLRVPTSDKYMKYNSLHQNIILYTIIFLISPFLYTHPPLNSYRPSDRRS